MGSRSRRKGARGEREAVDVLRRFGVRTAYRAASAQRAADATVCDVEGTPWWVEVKRGARPVIHRAIEQAMRDRDEAGDVRPAVALTRADGGPWLATMRLDEWMRLMAHGSSEADDG